MRWAKEGRQPGLSLAVASQQPSAIDPEVLSQCDIILSHKLTSRDDVAALNSLSQDYMGSELRTYIRLLACISPRLRHNGAGLVFVRWRGGLSQSTKIDPSRRISTPSRPIHSPATG